MEAHKVKVHTMEQKTDAWFKARELKMTASHAQSIASAKKVNKKTGEESIGEGMQTYIYTLVSDCYSSGEFENYTNEHMERGNELEEKAITAYEFETGYTVKPVGFVEMVGRKVGCSPDGDVLDEDEKPTDGLLEVKCKSDKNHVVQLIQEEEAIEKKYMWQMQMQMYVYNKKWCDYVCFNPNFKKSIFIFRVERDEEMIAKIKEGLAIGENLIKEHTEKIDRLTKAK